MKKSLLLLVSAIVVMSCDVPQGGNKTLLKKTDDVVRYDDPHAPKGTYKAEENTAPAQSVVVDSAKVETPVVANEAKAEN